MNETIKTAERTRALLRLAGLCAPPGEAEPDVAERAEELTAQRWRVINALPLLSPADLAMVEVVVLNLAGPVLAMDRKRKAGQARA